MKTGFASLLVALALFLSLAPAPALAQSQPQTPIDCSQGCYIITCNAQLCTMWRCAQNGCTFVTSWDRQIVEGPITDSRAAKPAALPEVAYASVCAAGKRCDLYELTVTDALRLGSFDNAADIVKQRQSLRGPAVRMK